VAANQKEAGAIALKAGLDVGISYEAGYMKPLTENVEEGKVSEALIDRSSLCATFEQVFLILEFH